MELTKTKVALSLMDSMIKGGEEHSAQSIEALKEAREEINKAEE